jgi:O-acetyl-ADP-ribose deacetylase (regulator of RNase III)
MSEPVKIAYVWGDATAPHGEGPKIIAHICNNIGAWGAGFVLAISGRWHQPRLDYLAWSVECDRKLPLGQARLTEVEPGLYVANMIAQDEIRGPGNRRPVQYDALETALGHVADWAAELDATVHMPRIGCGLGGGRWEEIEPIITRTLTQRGIAAFVYDRPTVARKAATPAF